MVEYTVTMSTTPYLLPYIFMQIGNRRSCVN